MMDILVTTPKSETGNSRKEGEAVEQNGGYWFRTFRFRPNVDRGDRIFFVEAGLVKGYGIIFEVMPIENGAQIVCDVTGRAWKGEWVVKYLNWHWLESPIPFKGFQGIRYINRLSPAIKFKFKMG